MKLSYILEQLNTLNQKFEGALNTKLSNEQLDNIFIEGVSLDSRDVKEHEIFGVFVTNVEYALQYIQQAYHKGVRVIVISQEVMQYIENKEYANKLVCIVTDSPRQLFAQIVGVFYKPHPLNCVAVTGTAGKTSVASLVLQIWQYLGLPAASIGTLGLNHTVKDTLIHYNSGLTTPSSVDLHRCLSQLKQHDIDNVIMEASSHGLDQKRLDGIEFKVAAFTNFSQDHLDYHKTMEAYFDAKLSLFKNLISTNGVAVLNADIPEYEALVAVCNDQQHEVLSYGVNGHDIMLVNTELHLKGQRIELSIKGKQYTVLFPLIGHTQVYNLLCAMLIVIALGAPIDSILRAVEHIEPVFGRLNFAGQHPNGANIYVDYAHKPQALELMLKDIRLYCKGRLHLVFGCGGDRDVEKRPIMGEIASKYSDVIIVTDDNPRTEDPASIRKQILSKCPSAQEQGDRREAIELAIKNLSSNDILVVAGKGHEKHQIIGHKKILLDDFEIISTTIAKLK